MPRPHTPIGRLAARQVNLLLALAVVIAVATGVVSWAVGTGWSRWWTAAHAVAAGVILVLSPVKVARSVRPGLRRRRATRWLSVVFGVGVVATMLLGVVHSTGLWHGVGYWSALWTHSLVAFALLPLFAWHLASRPVRPRTTDLDRRLLLGASVAVVASAVATSGVETLALVAAFDGGRRRATGSHEVGSLEPNGLPTVSWIDDRPPADVAAERWTLSIAGRPLTIAELRARAVPLEAVLDCTGGWWSRQRWDVVPIADLLPVDGSDGASRSFDVRAATGYHRRFPMTDARSVYLAVGYDGRPLRRGHGAPVRIVAPGRRGPWWVKWVVAVEPSDRPWWWQSPFPTT